MLSATRFSAKRTGSTVLGRARPSSSLRAFSMVNRPSMTKSPLNIPRYTPCTSPVRRTYATQVEAESSEALGDDIPWIDVLEKHAEGPWVYGVDPDEKMRLGIAHGLLYQSILYLTRPATKTGAEGDEDAGAQYLTIFQTAKVPDHSEIARARTAIATLVRASVIQICSVQPDSQLRKDSAPIFLDASKLAQIVQRHMKGLGADAQPVEDFSAYWEETRPVVVSLVDKLAESGFDLDAMQEDIGGEN